MALVDVGIRGLEFEVPDDWNETQVRDQTRTRYPFLFSDLVEASRNPPPEVPVAGPVEIPTSALGPQEVIPPPAAVAPPPVDAAEANYRDKFGVRTPTATGDPSFAEALAKEYLGNVSAAVPSNLESIRLLDAAMGSQALTELLNRGPSALLPSRAATRVEAARNYDPMFEEARRLRAAGEAEYDYNRSALPAWQQKPAEWVGSGLGSATTFLPSILLGPTGPLAVGMGNTFSPAYEEARRSGASPEAALMQALIESGVEAGSEYVLGIPGKLTRMLGRQVPRTAKEGAKKAFEEALRLAGEPLWKTFIKAIGQEGAEEVISGTLKDLSAAYFTKTDKSKGLTGSTRDPVTGVETPNWMAFLARRVDDFMGGAAGGGGFVPAIRSGQKNAPAALNPSPGTRMPDREGTPEPTPSAATPGTPPRVPDVNTGRIATEPRVRARSLGVFRTALDDAARQRDQDGLVAIGLRMRDAGFTDDEIHGYIDASVDRFWERPSLDTTIRVRIPRQGETTSDGRNKPVTEEARTIERRPDEQLDEARMRAEDARRMGSGRVAARGKITAYTVDRVRRALGIPDDVEIVVNTTDVGTTTSPDGRVYTRPGVWADGKITIWARNIRSQEHLRRVLAEENNHRILGTPEGQQALGRFLAEVPVRDMIEGAAPWLQAELAKYAGRPGLEVTDEFVAKLGSDPTWKRVLGEWYAMLRNKLGMRLSETSAARLLLRQVREGKVPVAPVVAPAAEVPAPEVASTPAPAPEAPAAKPMRAAKKAEAPPVAAEPAPAPAPPAPAPVPSPAPAPAPAAPRAAKPMRGVRVPTVAEAPEVPPAPAPAPAPATPTPAPATPAPAPEPVPAPAPAAKVETKPAPEPATPAPETPAPKTKAETKIAKGDRVIWNEVGPRTGKILEITPLGVLIDDDLTGRRQMVASDKLRPIPEEPTSPAPAPAPTAAPAPAADPGPAIRALNAAIRTGGIGEIAGAKVALDKFSPEVLAAAADRLGVPPDGPDLPGRLIAHARIGVNYRPGPGETPATAAERAATLNTDAALTRDVKIIGGKATGTKLDKAKQLVKRAQEIEVAKERARAETAPAFKPATPVPAPAPATEAGRPKATEVKKELVRKLEAALASAPVERGADGAPVDITITVPGGTYTMVNTKTVIGEALRKAKALETSTAPRTKVEGGDTWPSTGEPAWRKPAQPIGGIDPESWENSSEPTHTVSVPSPDGKEWVRVKGAEIKVPGMPEGYRAWVSRGNIRHRGGKLTPTFRITDEAGTVLAESEGKLQDAIDAAAAKIEELGPDKVAEALRDRKAMVAKNPPPAPEKIERSNLDAEYLSAVEAGDMTKAQAMVDAAAKRAGYTEKYWHGTTATEFVEPPQSQERTGEALARRELKALAESVGLSENWTDAAGILERWQRSGLAKERGVAPETILRARSLSDEIAGYRSEFLYPRPTERLEFSVFNLPDSRLELGVHVGTKGQAEALGTAFPFYIHAPRKLRLDDLGTWHYQSVMREARKAGVPISEMEYDAVHNASNENAALRELLMRKGVDAVIYDNEAEGRGDSVILLSPEQIKSAEPVTRDDAGNVIPLSERFNPQSPDIRENIGDVLPTAPENVTSPYEQVRQGGNGTSGSNDAGTTASQRPAVGGVAGVPASDSVRPGQQPAQARRDAARRLAGAGHPAWQNDRDLARELGVPALDKRDPYFAHSEFPERGVESVIFHDENRGVLIKATDPFAAVGVADGPAHTILREWVSQNDPAFVPTTIKGVSDMRSAVRIVMEQPFIDDLRRQPSSVPDEARNDALRTLGLFPTSQYGVSATSYATGEFFRIQDLNKGNVLFDPTGAPHIIDFVADPMTDVEAGYAVADALLNGVAQVTDMPPGPALRALRAAKQDGLRDPNLSDAIAAFEARQRSSLGDEIVTTTIDGTERRMPARLAEKRAKGLDYTLRKLVDCLVKR